MTDTTEQKKHHMEEEEENRSSKRPRIASLWDIPTSAHYKVSFAHRKVVTKVVTSLKHGYVITASDDGIVKFWKRQPADSQECLEFVKSFTAHIGSVVALAVSHGDGGDTAASVGSDNCIKLYDVSTFDVTGMIKASDESTTTLGCHASFLGQDQSMLAVSNTVDNSILIYSTITLSPDPIKIIQLHASPITSMAYNSIHRCMISADLKGILEIWDCTVDKVGSPPTKTDNGIAYASKMETQLYELMRKKTYCIALAVSPTGTHFCVYGADLKIRLYNHASGNIVVTYDERPKVYDESFAKYGMDAIDYGRRAAVEREMAQETTLTGGVVTRDVLTTSHQFLNLSFDPSGKMLLIPTCVGIKLINWESNKLVTIIGKKDASTLRFVNICLCIGDAKVNRQMQLARSGGSSAAMDHEKIAKSDALFIALAFRKKRLYVFSHDDPLETEDVDEDVMLRRDVLNEPPDADDRLVMDGTSAKDKMGSEAILRTTMGDIHFKLFPDEVPRTIENFVGHSKSGYYDGVIFHRVIKGFMLQTGDPLGDGTGGESIWGGEFEDEFVRDLRHDRPFTVSMANAGPGTNGSQFFITTIPTPWLDNKHTVFGRVTKGMDVCTAIENVKTDDTDKPLNEISILSVDIL